MITLFTQAFQVSGVMLFSPLLVNAALSTFMSPAPAVISFSWERALPWFIASVSILALWAVARRAFRNQPQPGTPSSGETQRLYPSLFESLQDVYYRADLNGIIRIISPSCEKVLGYQPDELLGKPTALICVHPEERETLFALLMNEGAVGDHEMMLRHKSGDSLTVSLNAHVVRDETGKIIATEGFLRDISERKRAERALRESQQLLASITRNISEAIYRSTPGNGLVFVNQAFANLFGYDSVEEILKLPSHVFYADPGRRAQLIALLERNGQFLNEEVELVRKDGTRFWGLASSIGHCDEHTRKPVYFDGVIIDITERKRIETERQQLNEELERRIAERSAELKDSQERFSKAFHASPAVLTIVDLSTGCYTDVNQAFLQTFGFKRDEVIGRSSLELNMWQDLEHRAAVYNSLKAGLPMHNQETWYRTKSGELKIILQSAELMKINGATCVLGVGQDITEMKRVQVALTESQERTRLIIDNALDAVITIDGAGLIRGWNPQAETIFGWTRAEAIGRNLAETIIPQKFREAHARGLRHFFATGQGPVLNRRIELSALRRDGHEFPIELAVTALKVGETHIFSAFVRDITERKRAEEELLRALEREKQLSKLKSNFVSMVSHEFRTPLGIIMSSEEILNRYFNRLTSEQRQEHLQAIHKSVQRMAGLMEEVLVLGRVEAGKMEYRPAAIDLTGFCRRLTDELHSATNHRCPIRFEAGELPPGAEADEVLLRHIFTNLLSNAVKYSKEGETVRFSLGQQDGNAVFTVQDSGIGIPPEDQESMFKAFHRGQNVGNVPGTGLGLTIVKRCVDLHGGKIKYRSALGEGTTFTVTLPLFGKAVTIGQETALFYQGVSPS